ncbi:DUF6538 domain-containing protein [Methylobacterium sp. E-005]|uniref:DUF6538 domain-containing protein n=1 Tax=Methylobacterium sp. E-005 TaxID=2836549 RepID=UPI0028C3AEC7|nr:DUF6538 domain-containing protein [Methylobacterium sp. E-005]
MALPLSRPWRHPKSGVYWYRRRVPKDLKPLLRRSEVKASLRTKDPRLARVRILRKACEVEDSWSNLRSGHPFEQATPPSVPHNRERRIEGIASRCSRRPEPGASSPTASMSAARDTGTGPPVPSPFACGPCRRSESCARHGGTMVGRDGRIGSRSRPRRSRLGLPP